MLVKDFAKIKERNHMLDLTKTVLRRVSFDKTLFKKELYKAKLWLKKDDLLILKAWCIGTFSPELIEIVNGVIA